MYEDQKIEQELIEKHLNILKDVVYQRLNILSSMCGIIVALLVVASFNEKILEITPMVKYLIIFLLILLPFIIFFQLRDLKIAEENIFNSIKKMTNRDLKLELKQEKQTNNFLDKISSKMSNIIFLCLTICICIFIYLIFNNSNTTNLESNQLKQEIIIKQE